MWCELNETCFDALRICYIAIVWCIIIVYLIMGFYPVSTVIGLIWSPLYCKNCTAVDRFVIGPSIGYSVIFCAIIFSIVIYKWYNYHFAEDSIDNMEQLNDVNSFNEPEEVSIPKTRFL